MWKKASLALLIAVALTACNSDQEKNESDENNQQSASSNEFENQDKAEASVNKVTYYKWNDEAVDEETITAYAEIKNTSDIPIDAGKAKVTFLDSNGNVISVLGDERISPRYINKGELGYISAEIESDIEEFNDLDKIEVEVSPEPFYGSEIIELNTEELKVNKGTWGQKSTKIGAVGFLRNNSEIDFTKDETSAAIAAYDKDDNFLAVETIYIDQDFSIDAKSKTSVELGGGSPLPPEVGEKFDHGKVKAIGIQGMDEFSW